MPAVPTRGVPLSTPHSPEGPAVGRLRQTLPDAWRMIRPYWFSEDRWPARGLLLVVVALTLGMVYLSVLLNQWNNDFFSALQAKNSVMFREQLVRVGWLVGVFIVLAVYQLYLNQMLEIRWRRWLTKRYLRAWLADGAYYRMQLLARETDNPDQRIAEDVHLLISHTLALFIGGMRSVVTLATFVVILWGLSGTLTVPVGGFPITLPGYMVWVALLYAIAGTWFTDWIGRPLVRLNFDRQRYEADFRFSLFVQSYKEIAAWCSVVERLAGFELALERVRIQAQTGGGVQRADGGATHLTVEGVDLYLPDGQPLIANVNLSLLRGDTVLLGGASGSGKSTLLRAIAGIWPVGRGEIRTSQDARVLFLPQKPYLPIGTLREVVSYPMSSSGVDDVTLREALEAVGLTELAGRLDEDSHWALQLSPGEQQRIAFARALVQKPEWLFLDEATSAVDEATEACLYRLVRERLAETTVFSIGHRATLRPFHARRLMVQLAGKSPASIVELPAATDVGSEYGLMHDEGATKPW